MFEQHINESLNLYLQCLWTERKQHLNPRQLSERHLYFAVISQAECLNPPIMPR